MCWLSLELSLSAGESMVAGREGKPDPEFKAPAQSPPHDLQKRVTCFCKPIFKISTFDIVVVGVRSSYLVWK